MSDEVVQTPFGKFLIDPADIIGSTTKAGTLWDGPGFLQLIAEEYGRLGEVGTTILDVGANQGTFSIYLASKGAWRVIAVEAVPQTMQRLKANLDLNKAVTAACVLPIEGAAFDGPGRLAIAHYTATNTGSTALRPAEAGQVGGLVYTHRLDDFRWAFGQRVSLIKLDVQGCELRALEGLTETLSTWRPAVVFEWEPDLALRHGDRWTDVQDFFLRHRYTIHAWPSQSDNFLALPEGKTPCV
jgi:FkbM family methyltransferase